MTNSFPSGSAGVPDSSMPTGAPGYVPRRFSYASVVSGTATASSSIHLPPARAGALSHLLNPQSAFNYEPGSHNTAGAHLRSFDMDMNTNGTSHGRSGSWGRQLPSYSSAFVSLPTGYAYGGLGSGNLDHFFAPSYLRGSNYVQRLEEIHRARVQAHKEGPSNHSSQPGSLSTSASSISLHTKMAPSHRGMTYDLIEKAPLIDDEGLAPLPSKWNHHDRHGGLEILGDGQEVKFVGTKPATDRDHEAYAVRADHPMPPQCGIYYFEVTILTRKREESSIGIGFSSKNVPLSRLPGWEPESWAYHGDDGHSFCCQSSGKHYGPPFGAGDIIGCGVNFKTGSAFFTKNGDHLGTAFREIKGRFFPSIGMKKSGEHIRVNFGQTPFVFDIDGMMTREKKEIRKEIESTSTAKLAPPLSETELIQSLVLQFLTHDGYVETAKAFAQELHSEKKALTIAPNATPSEYDIREDQDAVYRQRIRTAVLDGDIEKALKYTNAYYPSVLKDNENVYFRLRCRRFIEMIRQGAEMTNPTSPNGTNKKSNGHNGHWEDDIMNHDMDMDDQDRMDTSGSAPEDQVAYQALVEQMLQYGRDLQAEFKGDPRREIHKALEDAFALVAYHNPFQEKEVAHHLEPKGRIAVAEELNSAILLSLGKSSAAALEQLYQQTKVLLEDLRESGGPGAFVNIDDYAKAKRGPDR